jgi:hypothetical protein
VKSGQRPHKDDQILEKIRGKALSGNYIPVEHAKLRMDQREITDPEVRYVLITGYHEKKKDSYSPEHISWNYAIRGKTVDSRSIRIIVTFDSDDMLLITVIDLE